VKQHSETLSNAALIAELSALIAELSARLARPNNASDWVCAYAEGDALRSDEAAFILNCSPDTARRRASEANDVGEPLGICIAGAIWLFSLPRLLRAIEARDGLHERLAAEDRARKVLELRSAPQNLAETSMKRAATRAR
jgi:hypothetical protein